jgi:zinc transport system substrate-binding protein
MKKYLVLLFILLAGCFGPSKKSLKPIVLTTIAPYAYFTEQIAGDAVTTEVLVPANANPHMYEPSPKQVEKAAAAKIWIRIGDPNEQKILPFLKEKNIQDINLSEGHTWLALTDHTCGWHLSEGKDLHLWLDPRIAAKQAEKIYQSLAQTWPEHQKEFEKNYQDLAKRLDALDQKIAADLKPLKHSTLLLSHPALGYYCARYGLHQMAVECDGKDPLPKQAAHLVKEAKAHHVKVVFTEPQYNNKGAELIAEKLHLPICQINPYDADYFKSMNQITDAIVKYYGHQS